MKPDIEQFIKVLKRGKASYIPLAELGVAPKIKERFLGRPIKSEKDEIDFWFKAGYDYVKLQPIVDFNPAQIGVKEKTVMQDSGHIKFNWATEGEGIISSEEDLEKYIFPSSADFDYSRFENAYSALPEGMGIIGQYGDIFTMTWEMMGFEKFSFALFENPELISSLNERIGNLILKMFEEMAQNEKIDVLWYSDDIAYSNALLMSPEVLDSYFFPWLKKIGDLAKKYNKPLIYHTDGILYDVFDKIIECGVDSIHPIEPKAMKLTEVSERYGEKLSFIGHVDVDLLTRGTKEEVRAKVIENIESVGINGGYCVGSGNSIPEYVNFENYLEMIKTTREYRL